MSDYEDEREVVDVENDDESTDRRAHHNALERKRRDHIKDSFVSLRDAIPEIAGEKASRGQVLNKATSYIETLRKKTQEHEKDIEALKKQNVILEQQIQMLEKARANGTFVKPQQATHRAASSEETTQSESSNEPAAKRPKPPTEN